MKKLRILKTSNQNLRTKMIGGTFNQCMGICEGFFKAMGVDNHEETCCDACNY
jgi:hypothetical protein